MDNFYVKIDASGDSIRTAFGISDDRFTEFAEVVSEQLGNAMLKKQNVADAIVNIAKECKTNEELVATIFQAGVSYQRTKSLISKLGGIFQ